VVLEVLFARVSGLGTSGPSSELVPAPNVYVLRDYRGEGLLCEAAVELPHALDFLLKSFVFTFARLELTRCGSECLA